MKYFPNAHGQESPIDDETRERRIGDPPLPSSPHWEASIWLALLGYYTVHLPKSFTLKPSARNHGIHGEPAPFMNAVAGCFHMANFHDGDA
jgi:hypothetical protein